MPGKANALCIGQACHVTASADNAGCSRGSQADYAAGIGWLGPNVKHAFPGRSSCLSGVHNSGLPGFAKKLRENKGIP
jgi:hypothetical protein